MSATTQAHTLQEYLDQASPMLMEIPGLPELLHADGNSYDRLAEKYPDAVFTLIAMAIPHIKRCQIPPSVI